MKMATLNDLNMQYINVVENEASANEEIEGGAILKCSKSWTIAQLQDWLKSYDFEMLESVKNWLSDDAQIAEGQYLKVWVD